MQMTLLQMTQNILSALNSDEVNSISDTTESMQVATIIQNTYFNIVARAQLTEHDQLFQLTSSADSTLPVLMYAPDNVSKIEWLKYFDSNILDATGSFNQHDINVDLVNNNWTTTSVTSNTIGVGTKTFTVGSGLSINTGDGVIAQSGTNYMIGTVTSYTSTTLVILVTTANGSGTFTSWVISEDSGLQGPPGYLYVTILPVQQFIDMVNGFNPLEPDVQSFDFTEGGNQFLFYYKNDRQPQYCTVIENYYIIFDAYDNTQDSTLQASKTMCFGQIAPTFTMSDSFIPDLDLQQFPLLLNEAKSLAFFELKQTLHQKAEQEAKRQWSNVQSAKSIVNRPTYFDQLPNFGRLPRTGGYGSGAPLYGFMRSR